MIVVVDTRPSNIHLRRLLLNLFVATCARKLNPLCSHESRRHIHSSGCHNHTSRQLVPNITCARECHQSRTSSSSASIDFVLKSAYM